MLTIKDKTILIPDDKTHLISNEELKERLKEAWEIKCTHMLLYCHECGETKEVPFDTWNEEGYDAQACNQLAAEFNEIHDTCKEANQGREGETTPSE